MFMTLNDQMNTLFQRGLTVIKDNYEDIQKELHWVIQQYKRNNKNIAEAMEDTFRFLTEHLIHAEFPLNHFISNLPSKMNTNPFILLLLENVVHKVLQENAKKTHHDHFSIHYVFTKISEEVFLFPYQKNSSLKDFINHLVASHQLPIDSIIVAENINNCFVATQVYTKNPSSLSLPAEKLEADTIYDLTEFLYIYITGNKNNLSAVPIPYDHVTLIVFLPREDISKVIPFLTFTLKMYNDSQKSLLIAKQSQQWKDSVIMFNEKVMGSQTYTDALQNIASGFVEFLPFERSALFSYNKNEQTGLGLYGHHIDKEAIRNITENVQNLPLVHKQLKILENFGRRLKYIQPLYIRDAKGIFPEQYINQFELKSVVVVPVYLSSSNKLLGAAILDQGPWQYFKIDKDTFLALIKFGQSAGEILAKYDKERKSGKKWHFSPRELEVLKLLAEGASTFEAAIEMHLSEYTVRDYVSAIMQKMNVKNRTEAVAKAIREGLI